MQIGKIIFSPLAPQPSVLEREISQLKTENLRLRNTVRSLLESAKHEFGTMGWKMTVELAEKILMETKYDT